MNGEHVNCPDGPDCDPSEEAVDFYTQGPYGPTRLVCLVHDNDRTTP